MSQQPDYLVYPQTQSIAPGGVTGSVGWTSAATPQPFIQVIWGATGAQTPAPSHYNIWKDGVQIGSVTPYPEEDVTGQATPSIYAEAYSWTDFNVHPGDTHYYSITSVLGGVESPGSQPIGITVPLVPAAPATAPPAPFDPLGPPTWTGQGSGIPGVVKWTFTDIYQKCPAPYEYTWEINPNDGGTPTVEKTLTGFSNTGPNRTIIMMEGANNMPKVAFSGVILGQKQLQTMELWYDKRVTLKLTDDLNRTFYGIFSKWTPKRERRAQNFWYHKYDAEFSCIAYYNADGQRVFGRLL